MMMKYPVHKLAKDFTKNGKVLPSKEVMDILTQYGHPPKNHMQPLSDEELSIVFEYLTQHNQIDSIESVYADVYHEEPAPKEKAPEAKPAAKGEKKPVQQSQPRQAQPQPQVPAQPGQPAAKPVVQQPASREIGRASCRERV